MTEHKMVQLLQYLVRSSLVKRYHNRSTHTVDTVGRHTYMVLWLVWILAERDPTANLLLAALNHDTQEAVTSDVSSPIKRIPAVRAALADVEHKVDTAFGIPHEYELLPREVVILDLADKLEGMLFCAHEIKGLGNMRLMGVYRRYQEYIQEVVARIRPQGELFAGIAARAEELRHAIAATYLIPLDEEDQCL